MISVRPAIVRRTSHHNQEIEEGDSSVEGFEDGTLAIKSPATPRGSITGICF